MAKNFGRKSVALLLTFVMVFSMFNMVVLAAADQSRVVKQGEVVTENGVSIQKTATHIDGDEFEINLSVTTPKDLRVVSYTPIRAVLVLDQSNSMNDERLNAAKAAAKTFAESLLSEDGVVAGNQVAILGYNKSSYTHIGFSSDLAAVTGTINGLGRSNGTNIQAGIHEARELLESAPGFAGHTVVVLLSDGEPTYSVLAVGTGTVDGACSDRNGRHRWNSRISVDDVEITGFDYSERTGSGMGFSGVNAELTVTCEHGHTTTVSVANPDWSDNGTPAIYEAGLVKQMAQVYTVLLGTDGYNAVNTMKAIASDESKALTNATASNLTEVFKNIADEAITATTAGAVTDPMGEFVTVESCVDPQVTVAVGGKSLVWDVAGATPVVNEDGSKAYTTSYTITLDTKAEGFTTGNYLTNGTTTFTYYVNGEEFSVNFDVPVVYGEKYIFKADVTVNHTYKTFDKYTGETVTDGTTTNTETDLVAGEEFTAEAVTEYEGNEYTLQTADEALTVVVEKEGNVINVEYLREVDTTPEVPEVVYADVTVNHTYRTYDAYTDETVVDGTATSTESAEVGTEYTAATVTEYEGNAYEVQTSDLTIVVAEGENVVNIEYLREVDTTPEVVYADVTVNHTYRTYDAYTGETVVDGTASSTESAEVGTEYTAATATEYDGNAYEVQTADLTIVVAEGENVINVEYLRSIDTTPEVPEPVYADVTVNHTYRTYDAYTGETTVDGTATSTESAVVGTEYTAAVVTEYEGNAYEVQTADLTIVVAEGENVVNVEYLRSIDTTPEVPEPVYADVTVNHTYRTYDAYTGETTVDGTTTNTETNLVAGEEFTAEAVTEYEGNAYEAQTSDLTIVVAEGENVVNVEYLREVDTTPEVEPPVIPEPPVNPEPPVEPPMVILLTLTVNWVDEEGNPLAESEVQTGIFPFVQYSTEMKEFEGYTFKEVLGDAPAGKMNGDKDVIYVYTKDEVVEIPEEPVPQDELPEVPEETEPAEEIELPEEIEDIEDEEVPLADVPMTGDMMSLWMTLFGTSGAGLFFLGRKRKEEDAE